MYFQLLGEGGALFSIGGASNKLEYFIIGGCTIQVLYSRTMPRVVLALDIAEVRPKASTAIDIIHV